MKPIELVQMGGLLILFYMLLRGFVGGAGAPDPDKVVFVLYAMSLSIWTYQYFWGPRKRHPVFLWYLIPSVTVVAGIYVWAHFQPAFWNSPQAGFVAVPLLIALFTFLFLVRRHFRPKRDVDR